MALLPSTTVTSARQRLDNGLEQQDQVEPGIHSPNVFKVVAKRKIGVFPIIFDLGQAGER
jgi:hypothetical protein